MKKLLLLSTIILQTQITNAQPQFERLSHSVQGNTGVYDSPVAVDPAGNVYTLIQTTSSGTTIQGTSFPSLNGNSGYVVAKFDIEGNLIWGKTFSGSGVIGTEKGKIAADDAGALYFSIVNYGLLVTDDTTYSLSTNVQLIKTDSSGNFVRAIGFTGTSMGPRLSLLGTDIYVATIINGFGSVQKLDSTFNVIWTVSETNGIAVFDGNGFNRTDLFVQTTGELMVSVVEGGNNSLGPLPFGNGTIPFTAGGQNEVAVVKMDTSGQVLWSHAINGWDSPSAVAIDHQGNTYLGITNANNTVIVFAGDTIQHIQGTAPVPHGTILKWDAAGNELWASGLYHISGSTGVHLMDLAVNAQEDLLVSGYSNTMSFNGDTTVNSTSSNLRCFLLKCNQAGTFQWYLSENNVNSGSYADGIAIRNGNEYILGGTSDQAGNYLYGCWEYSQPSSTVKTFIAHINEQQYAPPVISPNGNILTSTSSSAYQWYFNGTLIPGATQQIFAAVQSGSYTVVVTFSNNCTSTSAPLTYVGIPENNPVSNFHVYPNPSNGSISIKLNSKGNISFNIQLMDATGRAVINENVKAEAGVSEHKIDVGSLAKGTYMLVLKNETANKMVKVVIK